MEQLIGSLYAPLFYNLVLILCCIKTQYVHKDDHQLMWVISFFLAIVIGVRPITIHFADTIGYAHVYADSDIVSLKDCLQTKDYIFNILMCLFRRVGLSIHVFFTFISIVYIGFSAWTAQRISKRYAYLIFLCIIGSFSFYSYGVNGIRNGMAVTLVMLALTFVENKKVVALPLLWCATGIHGSSYLPIACMLVSYFYKSTKMYIIIWLASIVFVNIDSHSVESFLLNLGWVEDDRFSRYLVGMDNKQDFTHVGFRWDFLLYSAVPIYVAYYFIVKKGFQDSLYKLFANTYILANAFWVLVINASFSNRFAYLSWFLYAIVLVYPFLFYPNLPKRKKMITYVAMGNVLFTWVMWLVGKL